MKMAEEPVKTTETTAESRPAPRSTERTAGARSTERTAGVKQFITDRYKILPARVTGTCAKHQRALTTAVKRARNLALLPFTPLHRD